MLTATTKVVEGSYDLIHCQSDIWCYQDGFFFFEGNVRKACENIDPLQPNYIERGILQLMNFARLFKTEYMERYNVVLHEDCGSGIGGPVHPIWEHRGATEAAHFMAVANRDCSVKNENQGKHWTCPDYCYHNVSEVRNVFKPFEGCKVADRKSWFQLHALRIGSYTEFFNSRKISYQGEAICDPYWPCKDKQCALYMKQERFLIGVGRAMRKSPQPDPYSYIVGTRAWDVPIKDVNNTIDAQMQYWKTFDTALYPIPSAAHYDKCILDQNCNSTTQWKSIVFQMTYAHHTHSYIDNTCLLFLNGVQYTMNKMHTHSSTEGATWAVFELVVSPYPTSCQSYYFIIQGTNGITYRMPQNDLLSFATTGNGCTVNHYTNDGEENCPGEDPTQEGTRFVDENDTPSPTTIAPTTPQPTTLPPETPSPTTLPPATPPPTTSPPTTLPPTSPPPTTPPPTTPQPTPSPTTTSDDEEFRSLSTPLFNLCLNIRGSRTTNNPILYLWNCNGNNNQMWYMDNFGFIRSKLDTSKCVTMSTMSTTLRLIDCATNGVDFTTLRQQLWYWDNGRLRGMYENDRCIFWNMDRGRPARVHQCINGDIRFFWTWN